MTVDYGRDLSCVRDLTDEMRMVSGGLLLAQALTRRWSTPRGMLIDDPDYGTDLRQNINESFDTLALQLMKSELRAEAIKDERVIDCIITESTYLQATGLVVFKVEIETLEEVLELVVSVSSLTVALISPVE